jgi:hypothetical protein
MATNAQRAAQHAAKAEQMLASAHRQFFPGWFNATTAAAHATLALYYRDLDRPQGGNALAGNA